MGKKNDVRAIDLVSQSEQVVRLLQETLSSDHDAQLSEDARMGLFWVLGWVGDTLEQATQAISGKWVKRG